MTSLLLTTWRKRRNEGYAICQSMSIMTIERFRVYDKVHENEQATR